MAETNIDWKENAAQYSSMCARNSDQIDSLEAEIERLRDAMTEAKIQCEREQGGYARDILDEALYPECDHEWTDARNKVVMNGEVCLKCCAIRAGTVSSVSEASDGGSKSG